MNINNLQDRLQILLLGKVISKDTFYLTLNAFERLLKELRMKNLEQAEMLFTHLPSALERMKEGEELDLPVVDEMDEVKNSSYYLLAKQQVSLLEEEWGGTLPQKEKDFLYIHFTNVISLNKGGNKA
ncbi:MULTISPECIES: PRD domain-containing protein [Clostridia]|uniref:PRD domain-containing protein n=1 Tax=Clostridia TaxID=186801 RepID=UPI000EA3C72B|nr:MULTISPECIES: PRD domain-containing protein [Clostridia]NBJ70967.1 PRD domain-containing protein [Roseburia sp. 1XD42-34]RKI75515.1 PRD domain-containing protein [Clostridium sp. 1xD42-85]